MQCHAIAIEEDEGNLFYQGLEDILYGDGTDLRRIPKFLKKIKLAVDKNKNQCGNRSNKKFTLVIKTERF